MSSLTALQTHALALLAGMDPPWTLTGGAWLLGQLPMERLGAAPDLITFRDSLVKRFLAGPSP